MTSASTEGPETTTPGGGGGGGGAATQPAALAPNAINAVQSGSPAVREVEVFFMVGSLLRGNRRRDLPTVSFNL